MNINFLAFAVPFFSGFMLLEYYLSKRKDKTHHFEESVANVNVGIAERMSDIFMSGLFYFFFDWIYKNFALFHIPNNVLTWVLLFLMTDLAWYWYHRFGHEVSIFWSAHVVHHQSEDFNYTTSARITIFQAVARCLFWSVLPLAGFHPNMIVTFLMFHGAYSFFTHTQVINKMGFLEYILVTPSHHRVHHASNPQYLDKNYGDVLIIWDKLFGTFEPEKEPPVYGLIHPLNNRSFLWQHFHFTLEIWVTVKRTKGFLNKLKVIFGSPDHVDPSARGYLEKRFLQNTDRPKPTKILIQYIKLHSIITLVLLFFLTLLEHYLTGFQLSIGAAYILVSVICSGAMLELRKWIFPLEIVKLCLIALFFYSIVPQSAVLILGASILLLITVYYKTISQQYFSLLFEQRKDNYGFTQKYTP